MGLSLDQLDPPLDDIAFLARSNHRVSVLEALARGPLTRAELRDTTGASQPTLGRILDQFRERGWLSVDGRRHALTAFGRLLATTFAELMATTETIQALRDLGPRIPFDELDFDLRLLANARITTPSPTDATAHVRREEALAERADRIQFFCNSAHPHTIRVYRDRVVEDGQHLEGVIAGAALDAATRDAELGALVGDLVRSDRATIYRYEGRVSFMVGLLDNTVVIQPLDEAGIPCALIESTDETVRAWAERTIEAYRSAASRVALEMLTD